MRKVVCFAFLFLVVSIPIKLQAQVPTVTCSSNASERQHCDADVSGGVALTRSTGTVECVLGKNWGYDATGVWVSDGCSGEFALGEAIGAKIPTPEVEPNETWGAVEPGKGFLLGKTQYGDLYLSAYAL